MDALDTLGAEPVFPLERAVGHAFAALCFAVGGLCGGVFFALSNQVAALCLVCRARHCAFVDLCRSARQEPFVVGLRGLAGGLVAAVDAAAQPPSRQPPMDRRQFVPPFVADLYAPQLCAICQRRCAAGANRVVALWPFSANTCSITAVWFARHGWHTCLEFGCAALVEPNPTRPRAWLGCTSAVASRCAMGRALPLFCFVPPKPRPKTCA